MSVDAFLATGLRPSSVAIHYYGHVYRYSVFLVHKNSMTVSDILAPMELACESIHEIGFAEADPL